MAGVVRLSNPGSPFKGVQVTFSFEDNATVVAKTSSRKSREQKLPCYHCSKMTARRQELFDGRRVRLCGRCWACNFTPEQRNRIISAVEAREKIAERSREHARAGNHGLQSIYGSRSRVVSGGLPGLGKRR